MSKTGVPRTWRSLITWVLIALLRVVAVAAPVLEYAPTPGGPWQPDLVVQRAQREGGAGSLLLYFDRADHGLPNGPG